MKKIISLLLCLVFATFTFVGCSNDNIGDDLDDSMKGYVKEALTLNFYIIGDPTNDNATVNARINNYTAKKFNTSFNIFYCTEEGYSEAVIAALDSAKIAVESEATDEASLNAIKNKPDIFLINSPEMMKELDEKGHLADLTEFFDPSLYEKRVEVHPDQKNKFHAELIKKTEGLHNKIAESLMDASILIKPYDNETTGKTEMVEKYFCVPNNRVVGSYTYLIIDRSVAEEVYVGSDSQLSSYKSINDANTKALIESIKTKKNVDDEGVKQYVAEVTGKYEDKAVYEANGFACNIVSYPQVAGLDAVGANVPETVDNVFNSAFAVNSYAYTFADEEKTAEMSKKASDTIDRAMEMIYTLNTDATLRNLLQFGVQDTNYTINHETGMVDYSQINLTENKYYMNLKYTGDMLLKDLLESASWTQADKDNAKKHNDQSGVYKVN